MKKCLQSLVVIQGVGIFGLLFVCAGTTQVISGIHFPTVLPIFKLWSNVWIGFWNVVWGIIILQLSCFGQPTTGRVQVLLAATMMIAAGNAVNIILLEIEWRLLLTEDEKEKIIRENLSTSQSYAYLSTMTSSAGSFAIAVLGAFYNRQLLVKIQDENIELRNVRHERDVGGMAWVFDPRNYPLHEKWTPDTIYEDWSRTETLPARRGSDDEAKRSSQETATQTPPMGVGLSHISADERTPLGLNAPKIVLTPSVIRMNSKVGQDSFSPIPPDVNESLSTNCVDAPRSPFTDSTVDIHSYGASEDFCREGRSNSAYYQGASRDLCRESRSQSDSFIQELYRTLKEIDDIPTPLLPAQHFDYCSFVK